MIRDFWVKNYLSIRDKQELSFLAKGPSSELITEVAEGVFLYKLGILYGSNASGKSNMLIALNEVFRLLVLPKSDTAQRINGSIPFVLTKDEPTEMHVSFYANGIRYDYDVKFNDKHILSEALYYYPNKSKSLFYERTFVGDNVQAEIKFGSSLRLLVKTQESIRENTLNNHSVLSVCRKAALKEDIAQFNILHSWIMENYHDVDGDSEKGLVEILNDAYNNLKKRKFYNTMLQKADLNILEYKPIIEDRFVPNEFRERIQKENIPEEMKEALLKPTSDSVAFVNHSINGDFDIPLKWQSKGTQKYIRILEALYDMITSSHVYYLDELGEDLHNDLLYYYLNVFIFNSEKSQLIITSQETTLLSQDLINENRGVVWFVEKNKETASSEYSRGDSFGLHKNLSLYNSYRIGRLGAKPELGSIFINLED
ncbi:ATP-binding protein [Bacteroides sp. KH569_7]|uniref:ATP-binding protein n=1 Tax=Bacteroides muris (ex Fokt et al. 2023) TaxID=2937417 RepID=A0A9X2P2K4_9BACE|nr:ATP-binding protein [Bacteroides muris (ex Fokt et al. 2023)]MCR6509246.1 ATP-binding protein [Bacteroides muris (ex Fokt et al. 2023)]